MKPKFQVSSHTMCQILVGELEHLQSMTDSIHVRHSSAIAVEERSISLIFFYCVYNPTLTARMSEILQTPWRRLNGNFWSNYVRLLLRNQMRYCLLTRVPLSEHSTNWRYILFINKNYPYVLPQQ